MRRYWIIGAIAAQFGLLAFMAAGREWILHTGRPIVLRTAPVDPRDPMRGEYVRLQYDFSRVPKELCRDGLADWFQKRDDGWRYHRMLRDRIVFALVRLDRDNVAEFVALTDRHPTEGIYLRGRVDSVDDKEVRVRYGVEALFTQQGSAKAFEAKVRGEMAGVPVDAEAALGANGIAVLRGYHWESLGITVAVERGPAEAGAQPWNQRRPLIGLKVELKNHGAAPVAIVDRPGALSFRLLREIRWGTFDCRWVHDNDLVPPPLPGNVVVLQPGESRRIAIDLTSPDWFVIEKDGDKVPGLPTALSRSSAAGVWFRIEYVPPTTAECAGLSHAELLQSRALRSRAFSAAADRLD
jgi:uncharacterized membrane-anchored protein